jgi:hypothetical protein
MISPFPLSLLSVPDIYPVLPLYPLHGENGENNTPTLTSPRVAPPGRDEEPRDTFTDLLDTDI